MSDLDRFLDAQQIFNKDKSPGMLFSELLQKSINTGH
jgi:hypothetical protein